MNLRETLARLKQWPEFGMIFAERISGKFQPDSKAVVIELSEGELNRPIREVAEDRAPGMEYFLEIFVALEVVDGLRLNSNHEPELEQIVERVIYYAEYDA